MGMGFTSYKCVCGGEIREEWDSSMSFSECDSCDNPIPYNDVIDYHKLESEITKMGCDSKLFELVEHGDMNFLDRDNLIDLIESYAYIARDKEGLEEFYDRKYNPEDDEMYIPELGIWIL